MSTTYAKDIKDSATKLFRLETKELEALDEWPTYEADFADRDSALAEVAERGYELVPSWVVAGRLSGFTPKTGLARN